MPLITIITVVHNSKDELEKTLLNLRSQHFRDFEHVIVDGASTDGTIDVIRSNEQYINRWISEKDSGIYDAMNKGINLSCGQYCCFLNAGDLLADDDTLQKVADAIKTANHPDVIYGNILELRDGVLTERVARAPCNMHHIFFCHQTAFVRTELLKQYYFDTAHKFAADFKLFKQLYLANCTFIHMHIPLVIYDLHGISTTQRAKCMVDNIAVVREIDKGWEKVKFLYKLYPVTFMLKLRKEWLPSMRSVFAGKC